MTRPGPADRPPARTDGVKTKAEIVTDWPSGVTMRRVVPATAGPSVAASTSSGASRWFMVTIGASVSP